MKTQAKKSSVLSFFYLVYLSANLLAYLTRSIFFAILPMRWQKASKKH